MGWKGLKLETSEIWRTWFDQLGEGGAEVNRGQMGQKFPVAVDVEAAQPARLLRTGRVYDTNNGKIDRLQDSIIFVLYKYLSNCHWIPS